PPPALTFLSSCARRHRALLAFPTRRSSDLCVAAMLLDRSRFRRLLNGIRDNEGRMSTLGYETWLYRLGAFVISGTVSGIGDKARDRKSTRLNSSHQITSYAVCRCKTTK